jgi:chorismate-pyruvate lyase
MDIGKALRHPLLLVLLLNSSPGLAAPVEASRIEWPDTLVSRLEALALLQTLNGNLLSHDSATLVLDKWCEEHHLAVSAKVVAERVTGEDKPPSQEQLHILGVASARDIKYRRVSLVCGTRVLSEADNWYVPSRLTPAMNQLLDHTDVSFGRAVQALHFRRRTLSVDFLWSPLPEGWASGQSQILPSSPGTLAVPRYLLQHRAVLSLTNGTPFSEVVETYTSSLFDFPAPFSG